MAVGYRSSHSRDGGRDCPLHFVAIASNMALAVGTTVPMSTQQHRLSVIAARAYDMAVGTATLRSGAHACTTAWAVGTTVPMGCQTSSLKSDRLQSALSAPQRCQCKQHGVGRWHDGAYQHTTAWAVTHCRSHARDGGRHGRSAVVLVHPNREAPLARRCLSTHDGIGRRSSPLAHTRQRQAGRALQRCLCMQHSLRTSK